MPGSACAAPSPTLLTIPCPAEKKEIDPEEPVPGWDGKGNPLKKQGGGKPRIKKAHVSSTFSPGPNTDHWPEGEAWAEVQLQAPALQALCNPKAELLPLFPMG